MLAKVLLRCEEVSEDRVALHQTGVAAAQRAVAELFPNLSPSSITVAKHPSGQPYATAPSLTGPLSISISHAYPYALGVASAHAAIGADIERIRSFPPHLAAAFLTKGERNFIEHQDPKKRDYLQTLAWTLKEATLKALGTGLRLNPARVDAAEALKNPGEAETTLTIHGKTVTAGLSFEEIGDFLAMVVALPQGGSYD